MNTLTSTTTWPTFWFPISAPASDTSSLPARSTNGPSDTHAQQRLILVIDDDPSILAMVTELLEFEGYHVVTATNGAEGVMLVRQVRPVLVLLDMRMPVLDGWGFAQKLAEQGTNIPILVMTAAQDARRWAQEIHASGYIAKPFNVTDLLKNVERLLPPA